eukprot:scaffold10472_cov126-Cylindrotheca_fusiformis.AAC.6
MSNIHSSDSGNDEPHHPNFEDDSTLNKPDKQPISKQPPPVPKQTVPKQQFPSSKTPALGDLSAKAPSKSSVHNSNSSIDDDESLPHRTFADSLSQHVQDKASLPKHQVSSGRMPGLEDISHVHPPHGSDNLGRTRSLVLPPPPEETSVEFRSVPNLSSPALFKEETQSISLKDATQPKSGYGKCRTFLSDASQPNPGSRKTRSMNIKHTTNADMLIDAATAKGTSPNRGDETAPMLGLGKKRLGDATQPNTCSGKSRTSLSIASEPKPGSRKTSADMLIDDATAKENSEAASTKPETAFRLRGWGDSNHVTVRHLPKNHASSNDDDEALHPPTFAESFDLHVPDQQPVSSGKMPALKDVAQVHPPHDSIHSSTSDDDEPPHHRTFAESFCLHVPNKQPLSSGKMPALEDLSARATTMSSVHEDNDEPPYHPTFEDDFTLKVPDKQLLSKKPISKTLISKQPISKQPFSSGTMPALEDVAQVHPPHDSIHSSSSSSSSDGDEHWISKQPVSSGKMPALKDVSQTHPLQGSTSRSSSDSDDDETPHHPNFEEAFSQHVPDKEPFSSGKVPALEEVSTMSSVHSSSSDDDGWVLL